MTNETSSEKQSSKKKGKIAIGAGIVLIIVLLVIIIVLLLKGKEPDEPKRNVVVNQENAESAADEMITQEYVAPGYYSTAMTTLWHFVTGDAISEDAYVANRQENTNDIYFDVFLADDESEPILQSPVIPRGSEMNDIALDKPLTAGNYDCVMIYHLVDDKQNTVSTLRVGFTIVVEK